MNDAMRSVRLSLYFFVGFMLAAVAIIAKAETITATGTAGSTSTLIGWTVQGAATCETSIHGCFSSANLAAINACTTIYTGGLNTLDGAGYYTCVGGGGSQTKPVYATSCPAGQTYDGSNHTCNGTVYSCPSGQNWTVSGSNCTRPDCVSPETRNATTGVCEAPPCTIPENDKLPGLYSVPTGCTSGCSYCLNGCRVFGPSGNTTTSSGRITGTMSSYGTSCSAVDSTPSAPSTNEQSCFSRGLCDASVNGNGACAPCNSTTTENKTTSTNTPTPGAPPVTTTTTTTNTCTGAGACSSTTTSSSSTGSSSSTTTSGGGGSTAGKASATPNGAGGFDIQMPTDYQRDETGKDTNRKVQNIIDTLGSPTADDSAITTASHSAQSQTDLDAKNAQFTDAASGNVDVTSGNKTAWDAAMSSGWFDPITISGCSAFSGTVGGHAFNLDPCPTAAKISEIGAYALWITLLIGGFVMLTGGKVEA